MPLTGAEREFVDRFADAFQRDDVDGVVALLTDDAFVSMPPEPEWHRGRDAIAAFFRARRALRGTPWRFVEFGANGQPAFAYYLRDGASGSARGCSSSGCDRTGSRTSPVSPTPTG